MADFCIAGDNGIEYNRALGALVLKRTVMQMVKVQIPDDDQCAKGFAALAKRGRVDCFRDNVFVIPEPGLEVLQQLGVRFIELGRGGLDYAQKALRDSVTAQAQ